MPLALAIPVGIGLAELAQALGIAALITGGAVVTVKGGQHLANQMAKADEDADQTLSQSTAGTAACSTCLPPECRNIVEAMRNKLQKYRNELRKYDPAADAVGGHTYMLNGILRTTVPGGHYKEIRDLQRGLKNDLERYNRNGCYDKNPSSGDRNVRNEAQRISSQNVRIPPGLSYIPL